MQVLNTIIIYFLQLSKHCSFNVQRVMHQRAADVKLLPHVQEACMKDLGKYCSENTEAGKVSQFMTFI